MVCPKYGGRMKVVAFLTEYAVVDRNIWHLKMTFVAEKLSPPQVASTGSYSFLSKSIVPVDPSG